MKVVILCGGKGTRLREETEYKPKPLVLIGGRPILWHIMKIYSYYGYNDFVLCLGYKGEMIKDYFLHFEEWSNDFTLKLRCNNDEKIIHHNKECLEDWSITFADTGQNTMTGSRIAKVKKYIGDQEEFFLTYGDGVSNINIKNLYSFHQKKGRVVTLTGVKPFSRYGEIKINQGLVTEFSEKPQLESTVNGGFFVCNKKIFDYLSEGDDCVFEEDVLKKLIKDRELAVYKHNDFWYSVDTYKHYEEINEMYNKHNTPWMVWEKKQ